MNTTTSPYGTWKSQCNIIFRTRRELFAHRKECDICKSWSMQCYQRSADTRKREWTPEKSKQVSEIQKNAWFNKPESRKRASERTKYNTFWKYRSKNPIIYESKIAGLIKLDSQWELIVAKRLDELGVKWYQPLIRIPYLDSKGNEHGYFPDFYVETYHCFIEVKSKYISEHQNSDNKDVYIKEHYPFVKWIESEEECKNFMLSDLGYSSIPNRDNTDVSYWIELENSLKLKKSRKHISYIDKSLENERWNIIQNSNIDFSKFGWVKEISILFGIAENKAGKYIRQHFPDFYNTCYQRKSYK